ncbi:MAG: TetR/AcrR family transcriptional regulator [Pseudomonadota bacterium]
MDRRTQIENVALDVLAQKGYKAASLLSVAQAARASNETMYRWYGNKVALYTAVAERECAALAARLSDALDPAGEPVEELLLLGQRVIGEATNGPVAVLSRAAAGAAVDTDTLGQTLRNGLRAAVEPAAEKALARIDITEPAAIGVWREVLLGDLSWAATMGAGPVAEDIVDARAERAWRLVAGVFA